MTNTTLGTLGRQYHVIYGAFLFFALRSLRGDHIDLIPAFLTKSPTILKALATLGRDDHDLFFCPQLRLQHLTNNLSGCGDILQIVARCPVSFDANTI